LRRLFWVTFFGEAKKVKAAGLPPTGNRTTTTEDKQAQNRSKQKAPSAHEERLWMPDQVWYDDN
jgi:hypothetical protein